MSTTKPNHGITLRQAALTAGFGYLLSPVTFAEYSILPSLIVSGNIQQTVQNVAAHGGLFAAAIACYLATFLLDIVVAWALYILLAPVNRALSLLMAWFQLIYAAVALFAVLRLTAVFRLVHTAGFQSLFGAGPFFAQVKFQLDSFESDWAFSLILFGIHLVLLGYLILRSSYIPRILGALLALDGVAWVINGLKPYLYPGAPLGFLFVFYFAELAFMLWLLIFGWRIKEPETG